MKARRAAVAGALLGLFASVYLLVDYLGGPLICLTGSGCDEVRLSRFAYPLGIPMPSAGVLFFGFATVLVLLASRRTRLLGLPTDLVVAAWALAGVAIMLVLTAIELFVIGAVCSWCLLTFVASLLLAAGALATWRTPPVVDPTTVRSSLARRRRDAALDRSRRELQRFAATSGLVLATALVALLAVPTIGADSALSAGPASGPDAPALGDGPVDVVVFSDFQCPACAVAAPVLSQLAAEGQISLVYRYFPLVSIHANATAAAEAAEAARLQGRFWEYHDALFASQPAWSDLSAAAAAEHFHRIAAELGLDLARWRADAASRAVAASVGDARAEAEGMGLRGTPTIFIAGQRYDGPPEYAALLRAVQTAGDG